MVMRVLVLSPYPEMIRETIRATGDTLIESSEPPEKLPGADVIVSYGYRYIFRRAFLDALTRPPINLHISMLPWNRGSDPNIWSWIDDTPKGVSIHEIDAGIDTGDIIAQAPVPFGPDETLRTSYGKLRSAVEELFDANWLAIRSGRYKKRKQTGEGSIHKCADRLMYQLPDGFDTPVSHLQDLAAEVQMSAAFKRKMDSEI